MQIDLRDILTDHQVDYGPLNKLVLPLLRQKREQFEMEEFKVLLLFSAKDLG